MTDKNQYIVLPDLDKKIDEAIHDAINYFDKKCPYCDSLLFTGHIRNKIQIDHYTPISKGGQHVPWNILPVCQKCNSKKLAKKPKLFLTNEKSTICETYLEKVRLKYVGQIQMDIEKYQQIKALVDKISINELTVKTKTEMFNSIYEITTDNKLLENITEFKSDFDIDLVIQNIIKNLYKIPTNGDELKKYSATELFQQIKPFVEFPITVRLVSRNFKKLGFYNRLERNGTETKKAFYVSPISRQK